MVEHSGDLLLLVPAGCCPHPFESWYTFTPARCPVCAVLVRVPLSQTPSLHVLRRGFRCLLRNSLCSDTSLVLLVCQTPPAACMWSVWFMSFLLQPASLTLVTAVAATSRFLRMKFASMLGVD